MQRAISCAGVLCSMDLLLARPLSLPATRSATESSFGITNLCDLLSIPGSAASIGLFARGAMLSFHWYLKFPWSVLIDFLFFQRMLGRATALKSLSFSIGRVSVISENVRKSYCAQVPCLH